MKQHEVIRQMGRFPDDINPSRRLMARHWKCSKCGAVKEFDAPVTTPAPCACGSIAFEIVHPESENRS